MKCHKKNIHEKNGDSYSSAIESHKLRKVELIQDLEATKIVEQKSNIFDDPISNDPTPVLQPTPWRPSNITTKVNQNI